MAAVSQSNLRLVFEWTIVQAILNFNGIDWSIDDSFG